MRDALLSWFGPLSLIGLFGIWFATLIVAFALLMWSIDVAVTGSGPASLTTYLYSSGQTFFTLGLGDVTTKDPLGQLIVVVEAGVGFGFLALMVSYLPVLFQAYSQREISISMLDARAGSPPSAGQLLLRAGGSGNPRETLEPLLREWERWSAGLLESHLSFPVLSYYRSQHENQSWLAALTAILDVCALLMTGLKSFQPFQAQLTFAMARHAVVDLALLFYVPPRLPPPERLPADKLQQLREKLRAVGIDFRSDAAADAKLAELRAMYEPFVVALAEHFMLALPAVDPEPGAVDNWQTSAWTRRVPGFHNLPVPHPSDEHFD
jgi:hypothetical protein